MDVSVISVELTSSDIEAINWAIAILAAKLQPFLIALEVEDKNNLPKISEKNAAFVEMSLFYAESDTEFLPEFVDVIRLRQDLTTFNVLNEFLRPLRQITRNLDDTATFCGSAAVLASLAYYNSIRHAVEMNAPNAALIHDDLSNLFDAQQARTLKPEAVR